MLRCGRGDLAHHVWREIFQRDSQTTFIIFVFFFIDSLVVVRMIMSVVLNVLVVICGSTSTGTAFVIFNVFVVIFHYDHTHTPPFFLFFMITRFQHGRWWPQTVGSRWRSQRSSRPRRWPQLVIHTGWRSQFLCCRGWPQSILIRLRINWRVQHPFLLLLLLLLFLFLLRICRLGRHQLLGLWMYQLRRHALDGRITDRRCILCRWHRHGCHCRGFLMVFLGSVVDQ